MGDRKKIAVIGVGIVGVPVLVDILNRMSEHVDITVYSFIAIDKCKFPSSIKVKCVPRFSLHQRLKYFFLGFLFIVDHIKSKYQVIHAQSAFPGGVMARWLGNMFNIPWIVTLIGGEVEVMPEIPFGDLRNTKLKGITRKVCGEANVLTVMSSFQADSVRENLGIERRIEILPYAPVLRNFSEKEIAFPVKFLHVAYHHPVKNHDMLLSTLVKIKDRVSFQMTIVGANYDEVFLGKVKELKLDRNIIVVGPQSYDQMDLFYQEAHILLHTSWYEGLPTVAFEAMMHGLVVCGTRVGIMADLAGTHCLAVNPGDDIRLAQSIIDLMDNPEQYQRLRKNSYQWARDHDQEFYIKIMLDFYNSVKQVVD